MEYQSVCDAGSRLLFKFRSSMSACELLIFLHIYIYIFSTDLYIFFYYYFFI